jgi:hypothetical protein
VRERGAIEVQRLALGEILGRDAVVVLADELLDLLALAGADALADAGEHGLDDRGVDLFGVGRHAAATLRPARTPVNEQRPCG